MFKSIKVIFVATVVCFIISATAFSFADKNSLKNVTWSKNISWFGSDSSDYVDFKTSEQIEVTEKDEFAIFMVAGSIKVRPSEDGVGRLFIDTKVKKDLNLSLDNFLKVDGHKKIIYLAHDENHKHPSDKKYYTFGEVGDLLSSAKHADVILELPLNVQSLEVNAVSADVDILAQKFQSLIINNVSGDITVEQSESPIFELNSVSGDIACTSCTMDKADVNTVSGDVQFTIADDAKYKVDFSSMSGDFNGDGRTDPKSEKRIEVNSVSGDFNLK